MKLSPKTREWVHFAAFAIAAVCFIHISALVLIPHHTDYGATWNQYLKEDRHSIDIAFFGSSIAYCNVVPAVIYEQTGMTSYVMAGPEQTLTMTEYYVKQALRTQSPRLVAVEVTGAFYREYNNYTKVNIGYMPLSVNRLLATVKTAEPEARLGLLFPLYNYHDRWEDFTPDNLRYTSDIYAGYTPLTDATAQGEPKERTVEFDERVYGQNMAALREIAEVCRKEGISLLLFTAPTNWPWQREYRDKLKNDLALIDGARYIDFNDTIGRLDIDSATDYYDLLHFNIYGAVKFSRYLAGCIEAQGYVNENSPADAELWNSRVEAIALLLEK